MAKKSKAQLFKTVEQLNSAILKAIKVLNFQKEKATVSKLNRYFEQNLIPKRVKSGESLGTPHLELLIEQNLLKSKKEQIRGKEIVFYEIIKPEKPREKQKPVETIESIEVEKTEESIQPNLTSLSSSTSEIDAESVLIKCPICSYYCGVEWDSCPQCNTVLTEDIKSINIVLNPLAEEFPNQEQITQVQQEEKKVGIIPEKEVKDSKSIAELEPISESSQFKRFYEQQTRYKRNYLILSVLAVQYVLCCLLVAEFALVTYLATEVQIDLWDYFLPVAFFSPPILYYQVKFYRVRKKRLLKDRYYSILLKFKRAHLSKKLKPIPAEKERSYRAQFGKNREKIKELVEKVKKIEDRKKYYFVIIGVLVVASVISIFFSYITFLALLIVALCFAYPIILRSDIKYLTDAFMLGLEYSADEYIIYLHYALRQIYYYFSQSDKV